MGVHRVLVIPSAGWRADLSLDPYISICGLEQQDRGLGWYSSFLELARSAGAFPYISGLGVGSVALG